MACFSAAGQVGERAAVLQVGGFEGGQAQAEQGVGGGDHGALAVRGERGLAQRVLQGGEDLRGAQVGRDGRVDGVQQALRDGVVLGGRDRFGQGLDGRQRAQRLDPGDQPAQGGLGGVDGRRGEVELAAVVAAEQEQAVGHRVVAGLGQVGQPGRAARRLGHLLGTELQELTVQPVPHPRQAVAEERLALRDLVHVVQLAVVHPAGVQVEMLAEQRHAHHRALQVPARRAPAPRRVPAQHPALAGLLRAPQREVGLAAAALHVLQAGRLELPLGAHLGQLAVVGVLGCVEVQAGRQLVGEAAGIQLLRELDHLLDVGAGPRVLVGGQDVQRGIVDEEDVGVVGGDVQDRPPLPGRRDLELVLAGVRCRRPRAPRR